MEMMVQRRRWNGVQSSMHAMNSPSRSATLAAMFGERLERMRFGVRVHRLRLGVESGVREVATGLGLRAARTEDPDWEGLELQRATDASDLELVLLQEGRIVGHAKARSAAGGLQYLDFPVGTPWARDLLMGAMEEWGRES